MIDPDLLLSGSALLLVAGPVLARLAGRAVGRRLEAGPEGARALMPAPPAAPIAGVGEDPGPARRFLAEVEAAEALVLARVAAGEGALEAGRLAQGSGTPALALDSALDRLSASLPHRLRITRDGKRLFDFEAGPAAALARSRRGGGALRALFLGAAALGNIGAAFPLLASLGIAGAVVAQVGSLGELPVYAGAGAAGIGLVVGAAILSGALHSLALAPWGRPRVGRVASVVAAGREAARSRRTSRREAERARRGGKGGGGGARLELLVKGLAEEPRGFLIVAAVAVFAAAVLGSLAGLAAWVAGLRRGVARLLDVRAAPPSPSDWTRAPDEPTSFEAVIPTNDVALAASGAIARALRDAAPQDPALAGRVLSRAAARGGRISPLEVVLEEGLDPGAATGLASRLAAGAGGGGEIAWSAAQDPDFRAPDAGAAARAAGLAGPAPAETSRGEYLDPSTLAPVAPRDGPLPSNLPGLAGGHLRAAARLAGGTSLLAAGAVLLLAMGGTAAMSLLAASPFMLVALLHLGALVLAAAAGHAARASARTGLLRDARRATLAAVRRALEEGRARLDATALTRRIHEAIERAGGGVPLEAVRTEVVGALVDLGLDPEGAAAAIEEGGATSFALDPLRERMSALEEGRREPERDAALAMALVAPSGDEGDVVFDSERWRRRVAS